MHSKFHFIAALFLLATIFAGMFRVLRGPTPSDRMMAAQLFGTTGVAILLLLSHATEAAGLRNVALVFALLSVLTVTAFTRQDGAGRLKGGMDD